MVFMKIRLFTPQTTQTTSQMPPGNDLGIWPPGRCEYYGEVLKISVLWVPGLLAMPLHAPQFTQTRLADQFSKNSVNLSLFKRSPQFINNLILQPPNYFGCPALFPGSVIFFWKCGDQKCMWCSKCAEQHNHISSSNSQSIYISISHMDQAFFFFKTATQQGQCFPLMSSH